MMYIGFDENILGLPNPEKKLLTYLKHKSTLDINSYKSSGFVYDDVTIKEKNEMVVEIAKNKKHDRHKKSSTLF
jgi:hypothetical protein